MQAEVGALLAELDPQAYVLDCEFNMDKYNILTPAPNSRCVLVSASSTRLERACRQAQAPARACLLCNGTATLELRLIDRVLGVQHDRVLDLRKTHPPFPTRVSRFPSHAPCFQLTYVCTCMRVQDFIKNLRAKRPDAPVLLIEGVLSLRLICRLLAGTGRINPAMSIAGHDATKAWLSPKDGLSQNVTRNGYRKAFNRSNPDHVYTSAICCPSRLLNGYLNGYCELLDLRDRLSSLNLARVLTNSLRLPDCAQQAGGRRGEGRVLSRWLGQAWRSDRNGL